MNSDIELQRVRLKIGDLIVAFHRERLFSGQHEFHANELATYIQRQIPDTTFDSASRILRNMRQRGEIDYEIISRRDSHYRLLKLGPRQKELGL